MPVALRSRLRRTAAVLGLAALLMVGVAPGPEQAAWVQALAWAVLVLLIGGLLWLRRRDRAAYEVALTEQAARAAVVEDRLAIARDLHDLVSGSLGAITVRVAVAQRLEADAEGLRTALAEVEQVSRAATADLRSMLAVLRGQGPAPVPGTPRLAEAVEQAAQGARALGLEVRTRVDPGAAVPAVRELALAVVREGLANVARHAGPVAVDVSVLSDGEALSVEVIDTGPAPGWEARPGTGTGLAALAERAGRAGARLSAGPQAGSAVGAGDGPATGAGPGFRLSARIPLDAGAER
ncbi:MULTISPECIES: sensor histidine kinase [Actinomyces]|uniref:histidine kinase n=1 Tax=Actinomyces respiraculi TaxID=2744574 RepID=A0A7T0LL19_9ACTO|nr:MULTISPECIES: histidine kinase [Actinomyces]QPL05577.1 two-component sensor histidine kinase [Actinomyces respiraculi]